MSAVKVFFLNHIINKDSNIPLPTIWQQVIIGSL
jgi:hypothetical protein